MARWKVTITGKGVRKATVEKLAEKLKEQFGAGAHVSVVDDTPPESRADRFSNALGLVSDARQEAEELKDELEQWKDSLPENLQDGSKAGEIDDAVSALEEFISEAENLEGHDVSFPGMY